MSSDSFMWVIRSGAVEGIKRNFFWAHVRRYFVESIPLDSRGKELPESKGAEGREFINLLFKLEKKMEGLSLKKRNKASGSIPCYPRRLLVVG